MNSAERLNIDRNGGRKEVDETEAKEAADLMLTRGGGMVALAATRTLLYIMLGTFPHIMPVDSIQKEVCTALRQTPVAFARSGDHGCAAIPKAVPTPKVQRRFTV